MNKLIKGSIAGAAGIALLLGGAGTLAYWNDEASLGNAGSITSGTLDIAEGTGAWVKTGTTNGIDVNTFKIVPGDSITYTETLTLSATGDSLKYTVSNNIADLVAAGGIDGAMVTSDVAVKNGNTTAADTAGVYNAHQGANSVTVTVTVTFPDTVGNATGEGQKGQGQTLNLGTAKVSVQQVA
ncbi:alternate-type signal peptide domain-containing protein [Homoserinimonas hongtaonis]|uniref:alternate-type signal peptide domain-containing protein n=1 Tax=Homoserinimonas hongtaonis TaxID=2079791 RepID=UPI000D3AFF3F|nr:alternate-type signal peptide domain-containing protein [Salinibacterium hongtaonis]AWB89588.1 alternate-type signal peptide domain-containing protein [Salinibacterium hongtaonis]